MGRRLAGTMNGERVAGTFPTRHGIQASHPHDSSLALELQPDVPVKLEPLPAAVWASQGAGSTHGERCP
jgi:hypothetical protein